MNPLHFIPTGLAATTEDSNGNPFNGSWVVATGNKEKMTRPTMAPVLQKGGTGWATEQPHMPLSLSE